MHNNTINTNKDFKNKKAKQQQKWAGGGATGAGVTQPKTLTGSNCKCCGRTGHTKSQCYHREKACDVCGKVGHVKAICRQAGAPPTPAAANQQQQQPKTTADPTIQCQPCGAPPVPWTCRGCHHQNLDQKLKKCEACHAQRMLAPKVAAPPPQPKPLISKTFLLKIGETEGGEEEAVEAKDPKEGQIEELEKFIVLAKSFGLAAEEAEGKLKKLQEEAKAPAANLTDAGKVKDASAEKYRILTVHQKAREALQAKAEKSTAALKRHKEARPAALQTAKATYEAIVVALNEDYDRFEEAEQEEITKISAEMDRAEDHFNKEVARLDVLMKGCKKETAAEESKPQLSPEDIDVGVIQNHLINDPSFQGSGEDAAGYAKSMSDLVNTIVARKIIEASEAAAAATGASSSGDVTMTHIVDKAGRPRPIRPGAVLAISSDVTPSPAQKREGEVIDVQVQPAFNKSGEEQDLQVTA
jgi:hypothetical protein